MTPQLYIVLENIRSAYNVGSVFRTCDSAGVNKPVLVLTGPGDETLAARIVAYGAYDLLPRSGLEQALLLQSIATALQKFRLKYASA